MKVRIVGVLLVLICCMISFPVQAYEADTEEIYAEQYEASGAADLPGLLPEEIQEQLNQLGITPENAAQQAGSSGWLEQIGDTLRDKLAAPLRTCGLCLGVVVLAGLSKVLETDSLSGLPSDLASIASFLLLLPPLVSVIQTSKEVLDGASAFMIGAVPVYTGVLTSLGKTVSAGVLGAWMMAAGNAVAWLAQQMILPFLLILLAFAAVCGIAAPEFGHIGDGLYSVVKWVLILSVTIFTGLLSMQSLLSDAADGAAGKAARLVIRNAVPVVGGLIGDATGAVQASITLLRSGIGAFVLLALLITFLPLLAEAAIWIGVLYLSSVSAQLFGLTQLSGLFTACKTVMQILFACVISSGMILTVCAGIILSVGGAA